MKTRQNETKMNLSPGELEKLDIQKLYNELKLSIEEAHVLRTERNRLLEQCNKGSLRFMRKKWN